MGVSYMARVQTRSERIQTFSVVFGCDSYTLVMAESLVWRMPGENSRGAKQSEVAKNFSRFCGILRALLLQSLDVCDRVGVLLFRLRLIEGCLCLVTTSSFFLWTLGLSQRIHVPRSNCEPATGVPFKDLLYGEDFLALNFFGVNCIWAGSNTGTNTFLG